MSGVEFVSFVRGRMDLAAENRDNAISLREECYWDGQVAAMRDILAAVEVELLARCDGR